MSSNLSKFRTGISVSGVATVNSDIVTTNTAAQTLTNKTINADLNVISNIDNDEIKINAAIDATKIANGIVNNNEFQRLDGVTSDIQPQIDAKQSLSEKGVANGYAPLDGSSKVPVAFLPSAVMTYEGVWNASTNTPSLADGVGDTGMVYRVGVAGTQFTPPVSFNVGDYAIYNGTKWEKSDTTDAVDSVNGITGTVVLTTSNINEGTNLYFTDERAQDAVGSILNPTATVVFTYDDAANSINANVPDAGITNVKIASGIDASKISGGVVSNAEFDFLNGVTSSVQTQLNNKADSTLNNLGVTAINADLLAALPSTINIGSPTNRFSGVNANTVSAYSSFSVLNSGGGGRGQVLSDDISPSGTSLAVALRNTNPFGNIAIYTQDSSSTGQVRVETGNASSGASGDVVLRTGTATATRGQVVINARQLDMGNVRIVSLQDPVNNQDAATKLFVENLNRSSVNDIKETAFVMANNVASPTNVTGFVFPNALVRSFNALVSIAVSASTPLFEAFVITGVQVGADWVIDTSSTGNNSQVGFSITTAGQIQYTSGNYPGFTSATMRFRAITTQV
jgi:hypothetical protein